jgi:predicted amidohydrolase
LENRSVKLFVATSQFPVSADVQVNIDYVLGQMREARASGAHVVHFCEGALSGYVGTPDQRIELSFDRPQTMQCSRKATDWLD